VGVSWYKTYSKWVSQIKRNNTIKNLGYFSDELDASKAYKKELKLTINK